MVRAGKEFGPNQADVDAFLERLETVDHAQALFLAGLAGDNAARHAARAAMVQAAKRGGRERQLRNAQREITRWVNRWFSGGYQISGYGRDITPAQAAVAAAPLILDAVGALVVADLLEGDAVETLTEPWRELTHGR